MYDKTLELLPLNLQYHFPEIKLEVEKLSEIKLAHNFFKIENIDATDRQEFKNPCQENGLQLQPIPVELWLKIFSYLNGNDLVCALLSCKFWAEITNEQSIRNRMGERIKQLNFARFMNKPNQIFSEISFDFDPLFRPNREVLFLEEQELYQAGDKGFVMK